MRVADNKISLPSGEMSQHVFTDESLRAIAMLSTSVLTASSETRSVRYTPDALLTSCSTGDAMTLEAVANTGLSNGVASASDCVNSGVSDSVCALERKNAWKAAKRGVRAPAGACSSAAM